MSDDVRVFSCLQDVHFLEFEYIFSISVWRMLGFEKGLIQDGPAEAFDSYNMLQSLSTWTVLRAGIAQVLGWLLVFYSYS